MSQGVSLRLARLIDTLGGRLDRSPFAVMLDIDGTLAPIAPTPADAVVPPTTRDVIRRLAQAPATHVALISGRSAADAARLAGVREVWIIGNHGFEIGDPNGEPAPVAEARAHEAALASASRQLDSIAQTIPGAIIENKRWTLCVHYRLVDPGSAFALIARAREVGRDLGLRVTEGKKVVELCPPVDIDKGTAALAFAARVGALQAGSMLYAGDDRTDEDAFRALNHHAGRAVTVRILDPVDQGATVDTEAEFTLASLDDLRGVLEWLVERRTQ